MALLAAGRPQKAALLGDKFWAPAFGPT